VATVRSKAQRRRVREALAVDGVAEEIDEQVKALLTPAVEA
jgi:hypothetical protein